MFLYYRTNDMRPVELENAHLFVSQRDSSQMTNVDNKPRDWIEIRKDD